MADANPEALNDIATGVAQIAPAAAGDAIAAVDANPEAAVAAATAWLLLTLQPLKILLPQ